MREEYRIGLALTLLAPIILFSIILFTFFEFKYDYYLLSYVIVLLFEIIMLREEDYANNNDNGFISGFVSSFSLGFGWFIFEINGSTNKDYLYTPFLILVLSGLLLRFFSKYQLNKFFSHSLRIKSDHILINHGLYKYIRHPSYLGTLLIIFSFYLHVDFTLFLTVLSLAFLFVHKRINNEERMMMNHFSNEYESYCKKTYRLIPLLY